VIRKIIRKFKSIARLIKANYTIKGLSIDFSANVDELSVISENCKLSKGVSLIDSSVGCMTYLAGNVAAKHANIGRYCSIAPNVIIGVGMHPTRWLSTNPVFYSLRGQLRLTFATENYFEETKRVSIGHDVWIGINSIIMDGISVGDGVIVAAGAIVTKDVPPYAIVGGVPAKIIRYRFEPDVIDELIRLAWWNFSNVEISKAAKFFVKNENWTVSDIKEIKRLISNHA